MNKRSSIEQLNGARDRMISALGEGRTVVVVDVQRLSQRERNILRMAARRHLRGIGLRGETHYDKHNDTLLIQVLGKEEE